MRRIVFEVINGRPLPRLPKEPGGRYLSLADTAVATGYPAEELRQIYADTFGELLGETLPDEAANTSATGTPARAGPEAGNDVAQDAGATGDQSAPHTASTPANANDVAPLPSRPADARFSAARLSLAHAMYFEGFSDEHFAQVVSFARERGFDVLSRHVWAEVRWDFKQQTQRPFIGLTIEGFRAVAHRTGEYAGSRAARYEYDADGNLVSAVATVFRIVRGRKRRFEGEAIAAELMAAPGNEEFIAFRKQAPKTWLSKCAKAAALRDAFPNELGGIYTPEEMLRSLQQMTPVDADLSPSAESWPRRPKADLAEVKLIDTTSLKAEVAKRAADPAELSIDVTSQQSFNLALIDLGVTDAQQRLQITQYARGRFPDLAEMDDTSAFYARAIIDVRRYPKAYGIASRIREAV